MSNVCRWGILGTANIARKNWKAIRNAENATLTAVGSRTEERAQSFSRECQAHAPFDSLPTAHGSYDAVIESDEVDAVYIPLPTGMREEWVLKAARAGKHVICEKPCAPNAEQVATMIQACRDAGVQFMDGVMFMHSRRLDRLAQVLADGESIGDIRRIATHHAFCGPQEFMDNDIRLNYELEPLGALGDVGWYNIRFILWALQWKIPRKVTARTLTEIQRSDSSAPVPVEFSAELLFDDGISASFYCSFLTANQQWANIGGTKGYLRVPDFVLPFHGSELEYSIYNASYEMNGCDFLMHRRQRNEWVQETSQSHPDSQETNMIRNFSRQVLEGRLNDLWPRMALTTQRVMDACVASAKQDGALIECNS